MSTFRRSCAGFPASVPASSSARIPAPRSGVPSTRPTRQVGPVRQVRPEVVVRVGQRVWRSPGQTRRVASTVVPLALPVPVPPVSAFLSPSPGLAVGALANTAVYILGNRVLLKGLSLDGYVSSYFLGCVSYAAFGLYGYLLVCLYFLIGSYVTKLKMDVKVREGTAEARGGRRGVGSVLGSGIAGMACAIAVLVCSASSPEALGASAGHIESLFDVLKIGFTASFCSKLSDTVSSEVGKAYGKTTYLATTLQQVPRGTEGAVSLEGTLAGVAASVVLGAFAAVGGMVDVRGLGCVIGASFVANYFESLLGASVQRGGQVRWLTNDVVNMLQISVASVVAMGLSYLFM